MHSYLGILNINSIIADDPIDKGQKVRGKGKEL